MQNLMKKVAPLKQVVYCSAGALLLSAPAVYAQTIDTTEAVSNIALAAAAVTAIGGAILGIIGLVKAFGLAKAAAV